MHGVDDVDGVNQKQKEKITEKYDEETVKHAVAFVTHPNFKVDQSLIQSLRWACNEKPPLPKPKVPKLTRKDIFQQTYKHYELYHGCYCFIDDQGFSFQRGEGPKLYLNWLDSDYDNKLKVILDKVNNSKPFYE